MNSLIFGAQFEHAGRLAEEDVYHEGPYRILEGIKWRCNSGGPRSRRRTERLTASILGKGDGVIRCPRVTRLALNFDGSDPLTVMHALLREHGLEHAEQLREVFNPSEDRCICQLDPRPRRLRVGDADPKKVLRQALLLGLSTTVLYDPQRPVLWTRSSLSRCLELYDGGGFYA
jgi:hypothetical protein